MLVTKKKYTKEATALAAKITKMTLDRHAKWLINRKYIIDQSDVDNTLSRQTEFCESVIVCEEERVSSNQRILLKCETDRVEEKLRKLQDRQKLHQTVMEAVVQRCRSRMEQLLTEMDAQRLFNRFPDYTHFLQIAYSSSLTFSKLETLITLDNQLKNNLLELVNNPAFCQRTGKSVRNIVDPKMALSSLGIDNCQLLFPILMAKPLLKWDDPITKQIAPKLWQHLILTANVCRIRLMESQVDHPEQGIVLGVVRALGYFAIVNNFTQIFDDALKEIMQEYRNKNLRENYYACAEIAPSIDILPGAIITLEKQVTKNIVESIEWTDSNRHLEQALHDDLNSQDMSKRSEFGIALAQAQAYSVFDTMQRSNAFEEKHAQYWFANVLMPLDSIKKIRLQHPGKLMLN
ncbi:HDOD domain-containing protein [Vibrio sp.]|uniref:HDOD domain-containing protein n=1 Tax=Vibrio sp. TaxID=678 RepID=UPI003D0C5213